MNDTCIINNYTNTEVKTDIIIDTGGYDLYMENVSLACVMNYDCMFSIVLNTNQDKNQSMFLKKTTIRAQFIFL